MIEFVLQTGIRISELIALKWKNIEIETGHIHIKMGKGKKDRILFCNPDYLTKLQDMNSKFKLKENIYVFPTPHYLYYVD